MGKEDKPEWKEEGFWDGFWEYRRQQKILGELEIFNLEGRQKEFDILLKKARKDLDIDG